MWEFSALEIPKQANSNKETNRLIDRLIWSSKERRVHFCYYVDCVRTRPEKRH